MSHQGCITKESNPSFTATQPGHVIVPGWMGPREAATWEVQWVLPSNNGSEVMESSQPDHWVCRSVPPPPSSCCLVPARPPNPQPQSWIQFAELKRTGALVTSKAPDFSDTTGLVEMATPKEGRPSCSAAATQLKALFHFRQSMCLVRHL